jgi:hypothetical protein
VVGEELVLQGRMYPESTYMYADDLQCQLIHCRADAAGTPCAGAGAYEECEISR